MRKFGFAAACAVLMGITATGFGYDFEGVYIEYWAGSGSNEAVVVVDFDTGDNYAFGYKWDGTANGWDALDAIDQGGALDVDATWFVEFQSHFIDDISYPGAAKGTGASWGYYTSTDGASWGEFALGVDSRTLSDGDWDGWSWGYVDVYWQHLREPTAPVLIPGDANRDGLVDISDFFVLKTHFAEDPAGWAEGNFNDDTLVDIEDFFILKDHFDQHNPEPATLSLLGLGACLALLGRRRKWC